MAENINVSGLEVNELSIDELSAVVGGINSDLLTKSKQVGGSCICSKCKMQFASEMELKLHKCNINIANA